MARVPSREQSAKTRARAAWRRDLDEEERTSVVPGERVAGRYLVERVVRRGGMGWTFRGRDLRLGRPVALKVARVGVEHEGSYAARLAGEARCLAAIDHPSVVRAHDLVPARRGSAACLVMEWAHGAPLDERMVGGTLPSLAADVARQLGSALSEVHRAGLVHRDIKPSNVIVDVDGAGALVRLIDFGIARPWRREPRWCEREHTERHVILGSPHHIAPEVLLGEEPSPASDVYALGVLLHELVTGRLPDRRPFATVRIADWPVAPRMRDFVVQCLDWLPSARPRACEAP